MFRSDRNGQSVAVWDLSWATWATEAKRYPLRQRQRNSNEGQGLECYHPEKVNSRPAARFWYRAKSRQRAVATLLTANFP